jgi:hypothetical protein
MRHIPELEMAIDVVSAVSRYLEDQRLGGEEWTVSIRLIDGKFTVWFQVECRVQSNLKKTNNKIINPRLSLDFAYSVVDESLHELRGLSRV